MSIFDLPLDCERLVVTTLTSIFRSEQAIFSSEKIVESYDQVAKSADGNLIVVAASAGIDCSDYPPARALIILARSGKQWCISDVFLKTIDPAKKYQVSKISLEGNDRIINVVFGEDMFATFHHGLNGWRIAAMRADAIEDEAKDAIDKFLFEMNYGDMGVWESPFSPFFYSQDYTKMAVVVQCSTTVHFLYLLALVKGAWEVQESIYLDHFLTARFTVKNILISNLLDYVGFEFYQDSSVGELSFRKLDANQELKLCSSKKVPVKTIGLLQPQLSSLVEKMKPKQVKLATCEDLETIFEMAMTLGMTFAYQDVNRYVFVVPTKQSEPTTAIIIELV